MSTSNRNEKIYSVAKKSTMVEAILTCNWLLGFEFYGMSQKKRGFVTFGIGYRMLCILSHVLLLIAIFGFGFLEWYMNILSGRGYENMYRYDGDFVYYMKIVIAVIYGLDIAYNIFFKIWYQIKVRNLMKEEENSLPMTQAYPQAYPQAYTQAYPQAYTQIYPQTQKV